MKKRILKKLLALSLSTVMLTGMTACGGSPSGNNTQTPANNDNQAGANEGSDAQGSADNENGSNASVDGGKIIWLSNIQSGPQYDAYMAYAGMICGELGYKWEVVYGDTFNDPAGNLQAVKNAMTNDVVAVVASQDGGIQSIMEEYPDLYVVGCNTDMASVYDEGGACAACATNEKFLGTIVDGYADGALTGHDYAQAVINGGYKKVASIVFPPYAYPTLAKADAVFREEIAAYNETVAADEQIEIVGEAKILEFSPLEESWFMEAENSDLDAIAGFCAGLQFVYPTISTAIGSGLCSADTKLLTGGFETTPDIVAAVGGDGIIQWIDISPAENIAWAIVMLDNALQGKMYSDYTSSEQVDSARYVIDSAEDMNNVMTKGLFGTADPANAQITMDDLKTVLTRYNPDATYAQLNELFHSDKILVDALK